MVAAGGEVWFGDETTLREYPPLRAGWARRGEQRVVVISGRNARRVVHGARNAATGEFVALVRERSRQDDCAAFVEALGQVRPAVPKLLVWENAPPTIPGGSWPPPRRRTSRSPSCPSARPNSCPARTSGG